MRSHVAWFHCCSAVAIGLSPAAWAQLALSDAQNAAQTTVEQVRLSSAKTLRVREPGSLYVFSDAVAGKKAWLPAACQPLKGERVKLTDFTANAGGVRGVNSAHVEVVEGRCSGRDGWIGTTYLDASR